MLQIGGISNGELNKLELEMLRLLRFRACVSPLEILVQLKDLNLPRAPAMEPARRSQKRVSEDISVVAYPAKLQHDLRHDQILVASTAVAPPGLATVPS